MAKRFLKLNIDSDKADFLALNHPNAFILLYFIARRARRVPGQSDGLGIGECHLGDWKSFGLSRQNYRTALKVLVSQLTIKILETNRTRKKSTNGLTTKSTKVILLNSDIWDINPEEDNHRTNHCLTTAQPLPNHKQEREEYKEREENNKNIARSDAQPRSKDNLSFDFVSWQFTGITEEEILQWKFMYSHVELSLEIMKAAQWLKSNPSRSKKKNWRKYLTGWLQRSNETAENKKAFQAAKTFPGFTPADRRTKDIQGNPVENQYEGRF